MRREILLELRDGQKEKATLTRSFKPDENEIEVVLEKNGETNVYPMDEICCILIQANPNAIYSQENQIFEEV